MSEINEMKLNGDEFGTSDLQISVEGCTPKFSLDECVLNVSLAGEYNGFVCSFVAFGQEDVQLQLDFDEIFEFDGNYVIQIDLHSLLSKRAEVDLIFEEILSRGAVIVITKNADHFGHITLTSPFISKTLNARITKEVMSELFTCDTAVIS